jgi:hypothetical protein
LTHNDNLLDVYGLSKVNKLVFYDNKDYKNIQQIVDYLLLDDKKSLTLDIVYYVDIANILYDLGESSLVLDKISWIESIGLRKYSTYEYSKGEIESIFKYISFIASKYVYKTDSDIEKFTILYTWMINNIKFLNEDDPNGENLNLISNVNKVFSYGRGGRLSFAKAFQLLLSFANIKSSVVYSMGANDVIGFYNDQKVCSLLGESDYAVLRVNLDNRNEKLGYRVRESQMKKIPYNLILGDDEQNNKTISFRKFGEKETTTLSQEEFIDLINTQIKDRK